MPALSRLVLLIAFTTFTGCTKQAEEKTDQAHETTKQANEKILYEIKSRLREIEYADARISQKSNDLRRNAIELREIRDFIKKKESYLDERLAESNSVLNDAREEGGLLMDVVSRQSLHERITALSDENRQLKAELEKLKVEAKD